MPKRTFVDIRSIANYNSLYRSWNVVSKGKDERFDVTKFKKDIPGNLKQLRRKILSGEWRPDPGRTFLLLTDGKIREIHAVNIETQIVQYALMYHFGLTRRFVNRTFGSIKGRGTLKASKQVRKDIHRSGLTLVVKRDVKKYYPSIAKSKIMEMINRRYKGSAAISLLETCLRSYKPDSDVSLSIGAITSQDLGNFFLTPFDYMMLTLTPYFARYVDDFVALVRNKREAANLIVKSNEAIAEQGLVFGKTSVFPLDKRRIDFCNYATNDNNTRLRRGTARRFTNKLKIMQKKPLRPEYEDSCINSYLGFLLHSDSKQLIKKLRHEYDQVFMRLDRRAESRKREKSKNAGSTPSDGRVPGVLQPSGSGSAPRSKRRRPGRNHRGSRCTLTKPTACANR